MGVPWCPAALRECPRDTAFGEVRGTGRRPARRATRNAGCAKGDLSPASRGGWWGSRESDVLVARGLRILQDFAGVCRAILLERVTELEAYGLGDLSEMSVGYSGIEQPAIRLRDLKSGWPLWTDIAEFCEKAHEPIDAFVVDLDFSRLDDR
jgi:hypothetical protein